MNSEAINAKTHNVIANTPLQCAELRLGRLFKRPKTRSLWRSDDLAPAPLRRHQTLARVVRSALIGRTRHSMRGRFAT
jgi:hypothetical protein